MKVKKPIPSEISSSPLKKESRKLPDSTSDKVKLYTSITDLMLDRFIVCLVDKNYSVLIIEGEPTEKQLKKAWTQIYDEYKDTLKDREQSNVDSLTKELNLLIFQKNAIDACLLRLSQFHSDEIVNELRKWTMVIEKLDPSDEQQYINDLERIKGRNARLEIDIRHLATEIKRRLPDRPMEKIDKFHFERVIVQLQKHMGCGPINKATTTVASYVFMLVDMYMKHEQFNRQMNSHEY